MAVVTVTTDLNQTAGVPYTVITDSSVDWSGVTNSIYFFDKATKLTYYKNSSGTVVSLFESGGGGGSDTFVTGGTYSGSTIILNRNDGNSVDVTGITSSNIYTADGTLTGNRDIDSNGNTLLISNGSKSVGVDSWNVHTYWSLNNGSNAWTLLSANASGTFNQDEFGISFNGSSTVPFRIFGNSDRIVTW